MKAKILAIAQQKGGVGKTTTAINLGAALIERQYKVLLVDLDPQGALSAGLGLEPENLDQTIYTVLHDPNVQLSSIIIQTESKAHIAPANIDLSASELELVSEPGRERILGEKLSPLVQVYDYILIDCPPSLGLLTLNALSTANGVIIPVQTQYFSLRGMGLLERTINKVKGRLNPHLHVVGILPTIHHGRTLHAREVLNDLQQTYGNKMFETIIPQTVQFADSVMAGQSILQLSPKTNAATAYRNLAMEVENRVK